MTAQVIIVGGGLAGLSAAHTVLERGGRVLVLDKNSFLGGNSVKATSGLNGTLTQTQVKAGIQDSPQVFYDDTAKSARSLLRPDLVKVLTGNSGSAVEWLQSKFGLDLSLVSRLGGHSFPRTHRGKERFPGMTITYALMERLEEIAKNEPHRARVVVKADAKKLLTDASGAVTGVVFEKDGQQFQEFGPVVIATGGYAADFQSNSLLAQYRPDLLGLSTTNGDHCTGDGIKMSMQIGGNAVDMKMVQVHPTGLVDPNEPDAKVKFLAAEALRGVGGLLLDAGAKRFCDELGHRDYVTGEMWKNKAPFRLVLNSKGAKEIEWHCKHYEGRGLMKHYRNGEELAKDMSISPAELDKTFAEYNQIAATGKCPFGKKYFQNLPFDMKDEFHVSIVTPVVHYCMGGLEVDAESRVIGKNGFIPGLYAAGEVAGGVHGENRLGGNSLLDCVVFGRVSGETASRYLFEKVLTAPRAAQTESGHHGVTVTNGSDAKFVASLSQGGVQTRVELDPHSKRFSMQLVWDESSPNVSAQKSLPPSPTLLSSTSAQPIQSPEAASSPSTNASGLREYTLEEIAKHNKENDCWVIINGQVIDATSFLKDHPGGKKPILIYAGRDASAEFNMLHKPDVIEKYAPKTIIGVVKGGEAAIAAAKPAHAESAPQHASSHQVSHVSAEGVVARAKPPSTTPSNVQSWNSGGTANVLPEERSKSTFNLEKMINYLDGGEQVTKRKRWIRSPLKDVNVEDKYFWHSPAEYMKQHVRHFIKVHEAWWDDYIPTRSDVQLMSESAALQGSLMNHYGLFLPTIATHGNVEQVMHWASRAIKMQIIGSYAQTELGHGSNVRGLQTTAVYDKSTEEFVLNTPTLQSMKWWPGTLGKIATHAVVYAQLIINGKEYGVHAFMLQLRDENHTPLSGIELGDLGPKLGDHANDTGYMRLKDVRIPRDYLLSKYQSVTPEGEYVVTEAKKKNSKLHYTTMIYTRGSMIKTAGNYLARAVTIATRYSCVRRQGFINSKDADSYKSEERKIIDYQVQRYRIFRQMALAYAIRFTGDWMKKQFNEMEGGQEKIGTNEERLVNIDALPDIAATSAGLKALSTFLASQGIEDCRKCCGGNGYLLSSGVAAIAADYVWQTTAEGDWIILMLQTARMLVRSLQSAAQGHVAEGPLDYLAPLKEKGFRLDRVPVPKGQFDDLHFLLNLFKFQSLHSVVRVGEDLQTKLGSGLPFDEAWNACAIDLCNAVRSHCFTFMLSNFIKAVKDAPDDSIRKPLSQLCILFACSNIADDPQWNGLISSDAVAHAKKMVVKVMELIRPNAVALVDAFDIPDNVLSSTIGRYDGNIYEALYESAQKSVLNLRDPFDGYNEYLRPHLDLEFLSKKNTSLSKL